MQILGAIPMNFRTKLKNLELYKSRFFKISLAVQIVLLVCGIVSLFGKNEVYEYGVEHMRANFGTYSEELGGYYADAAMGQKGNLVDFCEIALPKGVYSVRLKYETDTNMKNMCQVTDHSIGYKMLQTNGEHLYGTLTETDFNMWLLQDCSHMIVHAYYEGEGSLLVTGLTIQETNALQRIVLFWIVVLSTLWNLVCMYVAYDKKYHVATEKKNVYFGLGVVILFSSLYLMVDYCFNSGDLAYHLMRIEGIKDGILSGQFPVRIAPEWQQGYGYASSIFYCETLLYIAALFRMIGFTVLDSYRLFFLVINIAGTILAYQCFRKMFKNGYVGLLCSALYSLSIYRMFKIYNCGSLGEGFGVFFLPLIAYGFYRVFTQDIKEESYKRSWIPLCAGFCGLVQSHLLSGEMVGLFTIFLCLIMWKKVFRKETFIVLAKTVIYCVLISAWFVVPFADYMMTGDFVIHNVSERRIQYRGLFLAHLFTLFPKDGENVFYYENGMYESTATVMGAPLFAAFVLWAGLWFFRKNENMNKSMRKAGNIAFVFAGLAMLFSLSIFPWDTIQGLSSITQTLVSSLQFPERWLTIMNISMTVVVGVIATWLWEHKDKKYFVSFFICLIGLLTISNLYYVSNMMNFGEKVAIYNGEGMGTGYISGREYLPYGADPTQFVHRNPYSDSNIVIQDYEKDALTVTMHCENTGVEKGLVTLPLLYYKGYEAWDVVTGEPLKVVVGDNFNVAVEIPAGYVGAVETGFVSPWYWRVAEVVSVVFFAGLCVTGMVGKRKKQQDKSEEAAA